MSVFSRRGTKRVRTIADGEIKRLVGLPELKYLDGAVGLTAIPNTTGAVWSLNEVAQGFTGNQRLGDQIRIRSILLRTYTVNNANNLAPISVRFIIGIDKDSVGAVPSLANVLQNPATPHISNLNLSSTRGRFTILRDKTFILGPGAQVASIPAGTIVMNQANNARKSHKFYIKMNHLLGYFGAVATNYREGNLFFLATCDAAAGNEGSVMWNLRTRFTDA